jgi:hypothetical protein
MVKLCEYRDLTDSDPRPVRDVIATARGNWDIPNPPIVELAKVSEGWACAGSVARWDNAHWSVRFMRDNAYHGQRYKIEDANKARVHFDRITAIK